LLFSSSHEHMVALFHCFFFFSPYNFSFFQYWKSLNKNDFVWLCRINPTLRLISNWMQMFLNREKPQTCVHNSSTALMGRTQSKISNFLKPNLAVCHIDFPFILLHFFLLFIYSFCFLSKYRQKVFKNLYWKGYQFSKNSFLRKKLKVT
jgi:hypothetical protein